MRAKAEALQPVTRRKSKQFRVLRNLEIPNVQVMQEEMSELHVVKRKQTLEGSQLCRTKSSLVRVLSDFHPTNPKKNIH